MMERECCSDLYGGCGVPKSKDEIAATIEKELWIAELAYHKGPWKFQTEWSHCLMPRHPAHDTIVAGGVDAKYYQLAYNITGESWAKLIIKVVNTKVLSQVKTTQEVLVVEHGKLLLDNQLMMLLM